jgi:hypothetical protein
MELSSKTNKIASFCNRHRLTPKRRRYVDGDKSAFSQQKTMLVKAAVLVGSYDVALGVDALRYIKGRSAWIEGNKCAIA